MGFGLNWHVIKTKKGFKELDILKVESTYIKAKRRLIMIDEEGVIPFHKNLEDKSHPSSSALSALD